MIIQWLIFLATTVVAYTFIATLGRLGGGEAETAWDSVKNLFTPLVFGVMVVGNLFFVVGVYYGFLVTENAIPIAVTLGVLTSFVYSIVTLGTTVTPPHLAGLGLIIIGIYLLR